MAGCAAEVQRYSPGLFVGDQGHSNQVVFDGAEVLAARESNPTEVAVAPWRDESLAIRPARSAYDEAAWPEVQRPSLNRPGRLYLRSNSDTILYFRQEGVQFRSQRSYWTP